MAGDQLQRLCADRAGGAQHEHRSITSHRLPSSSARCCATIRPWRATPVRWRSPQRSLPTTSRRPQWGWHGGFPKGTVIGGVVTIILLIAFIPGPYQSHTQDIWLILIAIGIVTRDRRARDPPSERLAALSPVAGSGSAVELEVDGRTVRISNPDRVYFPARGETKLDLAQYYIAVARRARCGRCATGRACCTASPPASPGRRCTRSGSPAARPTGSRPCGCTSRGGTAPPTSCACSTRPTSSGRCRCRRSSSTPGTPAAGTSSSPTSGASTSTRCRGRPTPTCGGSPTSRKRCSPSSARSAGRRPRAARACTSTCGSSRDGASRTCGGRRTRSRGRCGRRCDLVDLTWWRKDRDPGVDLRRLQPEHPRPHDPLRLLGARGRRRRWCRRRSGGTRSTTPIPATSRSRPCRSGSPSWATCTRASTTPSTRLDELLEWADRDAARGRGGLPEEARGPRVTGTTPWHAQTPGGQRRAA